MDLHRFAELGRDGVLLLIVDSTNAERPGYTLSERVVGQAFDQVFDEAPGRILVATFPAISIESSRSLTPLPNTVGRLVLSAA